MGRKKFVLGIVAVILVTLVIGWFAHAETSGVDVSAAGSGTEATTVDAGQDVALGDETFYWKGDDGSAATLSFHGSGTTMLVDCKDTKGDGTMGGRTGTDLECTVSDTSVRFAGRTFDIAQTDGITTLTNTDDAWGTYYSSADAAATHPQTRQTS